MRLPLLLGSVLLALIACHGGKIEGGAYRVATGGNHDRGKLWIRQTGCGSCHVIPGVRGAHGLVGPPLTRFALRSIIAGRVPNTVPNLVQWLQQPASIDSATAMPDVGLNEQQARDVAAYLYTLD